MGVVELFGELGVLCEQALELGRELAPPGLRPIASSGIPAVLLAGLGGRSGPVAIVARVDLEGSCDRRAKLLGEAFLEHRVQEMAR